jgi:hypothetical protein
VARMGEMDRAQWWNTKGQLGPLGAMALSRGLPRTHYFAQARSVFAVAAHRCDQGCRSTTRDGEEEREWLLRTSRSRT